MYKNGLVHGSENLKKLNWAFNNKLVDRLQNYYGMAIRSNVGDLNKMKKAIYAALFHARSSEKDNYHAHCPTGVDSWCTYHLDIANTTELHKPTKGLPEEAIKH